MDPGEWVVQYPASAIERNAGHQTAIRTHGLSRELFEEYVIERFDGTIDEYEYVLRHFVEASIRERIVDSRGPAVDTAGQGRVLKRAIFRPDYHCDSPIRAPWVQEAKGTREETSFYGRGHAGSRKTVEYRFWGDVVVFSRQWRHDFISSSETIQRLRNVARGRRTGNFQYSK
jgi:hypothetical protein